jgi:hypothetical protein
MANKKNGFANIVGSKSPELKMPKSVSEMPNFAKKSNITDNNAVALFLNRRDDI